MFRRFVVVVCCGLGLLNAVLGVIAVVATLTILNEPAVVTNSQAALSRDEVKNQLATDVANTVLANMPAAGRTEAAATAIRRSARGVVADPEFQALWSEAIAAQYAAVFNGKREIIVLDPTTTTRLARTQLAAISPEVVALLPPSTVLEVRIATTTLPDLQTEATWAKRMLLAGPLTLIWFAIAVAVSPHRVRTVRRIGWWLLGTGVLLLIGAFAVPQWGVPFAIRARDLQPSINRTLLETLTFAWWRTYGPPAALALVGLFLAILGIILGRRAPENRITRTVEELPEAVEGQAAVDEWNCKV